LAFREKKLKLFANITKAAMNLINRIVNKVFQLLDPPVDVAFGSLLEKFLS